MTLNTCAIAWRPGSGETATRSASSACALQEWRRIPLGGVRHEPRNRLEQLGNAGARFRRHEADWHEMPLAQRLLERIVQLFRLELFTLLQVEGHQVVVDFDHLVDDAGMRFLDRREVGRLAVIMEKAVDDFRAAGRRQVDGEAFGSELVADFLERRLRICVAGIDLVDDEDAAQAPVPGRVHHALRHRLDAGDGVDDDGRGFHGLQHRQRAADEVGVAGRIDEIDVGIAGFEPAKR